MKFVHIADIHFDAPFKTITDRAELGQVRRIEQKEAFKNVIKFIKENNVEYLFISGDLYEQEYIKKSTINYINELFKEIGNTEIFIAPGNHDPYINNSYYKNFEWADNVKIFTENAEKVEKDDVCIYGYGFNNYEMNLNQLKDINIEDKSKINILITHGTVINGNELSGVYNPISRNELISKDFDYIALGHIHKRDEFYPGSLISLGFDELGKHGFIYGEINNKKINTEFIKADKRELKEVDFEVSDIYSEEEIIEKLNLIDTENNLYKINLIGERNFLINLDIKIIQKNIIKIKDNTKLKIEIKENNNTLKGIIIKQLNKKIENKEINKNEYEEILELIIKIFNN